MTRETKIGLLVGLAFIIVIGILLADYSTSSMQAPQAALLGVADNVLESARPPGARRATGPVVVPDIEPNRQVVTPNEQADRRAEVRFGPNQGPAHQIVIPEPPQGTMDAPQAFGNPGAGGNGPVVIEVPDRGEPRAPIGANDQLAMEGMRQLKAETGDTVSRWATRYFGSNTKANREAIIKANPNLVANPDKIVVGETYLIPLNMSNTPTPPGQPQQNRGNVQTPLPQQPEPQPVGTVSYTTKPGDSLWKIAVEQCGSPGMVDKIRELNKDVLKGEIGLRPNVALKLPRKAAPARQ